ncbi:DUF6807 family protein [Novipirellula herctigrandis]
MAIRDLSDKSVGIFDGERPVLVYNHGVMVGEHVPKQDHRWKRACYIHPVYDLSGDVLTEDFPKDHYHHHGVFWTWPYVKVEDKTFDTWQGTGMDQRFVRWIDRKVGVDAVTLAVENGWFIGEKKVMIEQVEITVNRAGADSQAVDVRLLLTPTEQPVTLQGRGGKSYGGLTMRFRSKAKEDVTITVPTGRTREDLKMTPLQWVDYTSKHSDADDMSGATVMIHPQHPDYPPMWLTRHYGPQCVGWPGVEAQTLVPGETTQLDYRIWIHRGLPELEQLKKAYEDYSSNAN